MSLNKHIIEVQTRGADKSKKQINGVSNGLKNMAKQAAIAAGAYFGTRMLLDAVKTSVDLFGKQEEAEKKLRFAAGAATNELIKQANAIQRNSRFGDEAVIAQQAYVKSLGISTEQTKEIIEASVDLAAAMNISLESAVMNVTKTLSGMQGELGEKLPAAFKELTPEALKAGEGIKFIAEQFGGTAQADAESMTGQIDQMKNAAGDAGEAFGELLAPAVKRTAGFFQTAAENVSSFFQSINESDIDEVIRKLGEFNEFGETIKSLELIKLQSSLRDVNKEIDEQGIKFKTSEQAANAINKISEGAVTIDEHINNKLDDRTNKLSKLVAVQDALKNLKTMERDEEGRILVLNEASGRTKAFTLQELIDKEMQLQTALSYRDGQMRTISQLEAEVLEFKQSGVVVASDLARNANKEFDVILNKVDVISEEMMLLREKESIEQRISDLKAGGNGGFKEEGDDVKDLQKIWEDFIRTRQEAAAAEEAASLVMEKSSRQAVSDLQVIAQEYPRAAKAAKAAAIGMTIFDTYKAAQSTFASFVDKTSGIPAPYNVILGAAGAALAVTAGLARVQSIIKAQYGADFVTQGPQMMMVGEGSGPERVQVTPLSDPNIDGPQGQGIVLNIQGNVLHESFVEDNIIPQIREGLRLGENMGI